MVKELFIGSTSGTGLSTGVATCPAGYKVTGGGYDLTGIPSGGAVSLIESFPGTSEIPGDTGWRVTMKGTSSNNSSGSYSYTVVALCVNFSPDDSTQEAPGPVASNPPAGGVE